MEGTMPGRRLRLVVSRRRKTRNMRRTSTGGEQPTSGGVIIARTKVDQKQKRESADVDAPAPPSFELSFVLNAAQTTTKKIGEGFENVDKLVFKSVAHGEFTYRATLVIIIDENQIDPWSLDAMLCGDEITFRRDGSKRMKALDKFIDKQKK